MSKAFLTMRRSVTLLIVLASCKRAGPQPVPAPSSTNTSVGSATVAITPPASSVPVAAPSALMGGRESVTATRWNDAVNTKDSAVLGALYGAQVKYYGLTLDGSACVKRTTEAIGKSRGYHQDITITDVGWQNRTTVTPNRATVSFTKRTGGEESAAYLVVEADTWTVVEESDFETDASLLKAGACLPYGQAVTLTGKLTEEKFPVHDHIETGYILHLDRAVCVLKGKHDDSHLTDYDYQRANPRIDDVVEMHLTLNGGVPAGEIGKNVTVKGSLFPKENWHHFTDVLIGADAISPL